jgi:hypothetical protein
MLRVRKPEGEAILAAEKDDLVCTDPVDADRTTLHAQVVTAPEAFFGVDKVPSPGPQG